MMKPNFPRRVWAASLFVIAACSAPANAEITVNGIALDEPTRAALTGAYGAIPDGGYWYDPASGLWGVAGGPSVGRILPGLALGGPLAANASGGGDGALTGVFINGREIHPQELMLLTQLFGYVNPGRYWLGPMLIGGVEGGAAGVRFARRRGERGRRWRIGLQQEHALRRSDERWSVCGLSPSERGQRHDRQLLSRDGI